MGIDFFDIDTDNLTATKYFFQKNNLPSEYEKSQYLAKTWGTESVEFFLVNDGCDSFERWGRSFLLWCPQNTLTTRSLQFFFFFFSILKVWQNFPILHKIPLNLHISKSNFVSSPKSENSPPPKKKTLVLYGRDNFGVASQKLYVLWTPLYT